MLKCIICNKVSGDWIITQ